MLKNIGIIREEFEPINNKKKVVWEFDEVTLIEETSKTLISQISERIANYFIEEIFLKDKKLVRKLKKKILKSIYNSRNEIIKDIINEKKIK